MTLGTPRFFLILALTLFYGGDIAGAQTVRPSVNTPANVAHGNEVISGVVVSSASGQPLEAADVTLTDTKTTALVAEVNSDAQGRFSFGHLADGKYSLRATHRGFISSAFDAHEGFSSAIVTGDGLLSTGLKFELKPLAVIFGVITDDSGEPVEQARITLYRPDERGGTGRIVRVNAVTSDDLGNYEFPRMPPGNYYLSVIAQPWYATHRQASAEQSNDPSLQKPRSPLDVAYPITYYADVTDADAATPIPVKAGDRIPVNFALHAVPAVSITLQISNSQRGGMPAMPQFWQDVFGTRQADGMRNVSYSSHEDGSGAPGTTTVELSGIAPGHYEMELRPPRGESGRSMSFDASSDRQTIDGNAGEMLADVSGKVMMAEGQKLPAGLSMALESQQSEDRNGTGVADDGTFTIHGIHPGTYELVPEGSRSTVAAVQITASGATVDNQILKIGTAPVTLVATLVEGTATVTGFVKSEGKGVAGALVVLVPKSAGTSRDFFRRDQSDSDGSFTFKRVMPGEYTAVAIADGWEVEWARREVIAHYLPKGVKVSVPANAKEIPLPGAVDLQPR